MKTWLCFLLTYVLFACASSACAQDALLYDDALLETPDAGPVCSYRVEYHGWAMRRHPIPMGQLPF